MGNRPTRHNKTEPFEGLDFYDACSSGDLVLVLRMIPLIELDAVTGRGLCDIFTLSKGTPLHAATENNHSVIVRLLLNTDECDLTAKTLRTQWLHRNYIMTKNDFFKKLLTSWRQMS